MRFGYGEDALYRTDTGPVIPDDDFDRDASPSAGRQMKQAGFNG